MCRRFVFIALLVLSSAAEAAPKPDPAIAGRWRVVAAEPGPWENTPPRATPLLRARFVFAPRRLRAPAPMACAPAEFETVTVPPAGLFQGALPEPNADELAAKLGLAADGDSTTYRVTCPNASFDFHRAADGVSVKFALDGVIYTLRRAERRGSASQRRP